MSKLHRIHEKRRRCFEWVIGRPVATLATYFITTSPLFKAANQPAIEFDGDQGIRKTITAQVWYLETGTDSKALSLVEFKAGSVAPTFLSEISRISPRRVTVCVEILRRSPLSRASREPVSYRASRTPDSNLKFVMNPTTVKWKHRDRRDQRTAI
ncbi:hypothetical protein FRC02_004372 [Tulasnella sp. 418]|nr:hypothetical protein FRC02_004372 [Tulasnella sp. 418]